VLQQFLSNSAISRDRLEEQMGASAGDGNFLAIVIQVELSGLTLILGGFNTNTPTSSSGLREIDRP